MLQWMLEERCRVELFCSGCYRRDLGLSCVAMGLENCLGLICIVVRSKEEI